MENYFERKTMYNRISFRCAVGRSIERGNEMHPYYEILYLINGEGYFLSENFQEELHGGTLFLIPPETYHRFQLGNQNSYSRLIISFPDIPELDGLIKPLMNEINIIKEITPSVAALLSKMVSILNAGGEAEVKTYLYGAFLMLISELSLCPPKAITPTFAEKNSLVQSCIKYIEENLADDIPVGSLAERMNVSQATLFKSFKKQLGISVHKYISEKRLLLAHKLIRSGEKPTKIYLRCGFGDYTAFYKSYTKMFGHPPSADRQITQTFNTL